MKCPRCKKFLRTGTMEKWATKPNGKKITILASFESCTCGYRRVEDWRAKAEKWGYTPI